MAKSLPGKSSYWWILLIEGLLQLVLGVLLLVSTDISVFLLIQLLGLYWLIRGIIMIFQAFIIHGKDFGMMILGGILGIVSGFVVLRYPLFSGFIMLEFLVLIIAFVGMVQGTISIVRGLQDSLGELILGIILWIIALFLIFNPL